MPPISEPWGVYIAGHPKNDTLTNQLFDLTGQVDASTKRHATISGTGYSTGTSSGNGAAASIPYIDGTTATQIQWPTGSIPTNFTLCSITRVTEATQGTLLMGYKTTDQPNVHFVHGHWFVPERCSGVAYYGDGWKTQPSSAATSAASYQNWLVMCGSNGTNATPNNILANGVEVGTANGGGSLGLEGILRINQGPPISKSKFQFQQIIIWASALTNTELKTISDLQLGYLSTGKISYPFNKIIGTNPVITSITNNGTNFSVIFTQDVRGNELSGYKYSLNGGTSFTTPTQSITTSPITISTIDGTVPIANNTIYYVSIIVTSTAGDTEKSTPMYAIISTPPVITSITNEGSDFKVNFTQGVTGDTITNGLSYWYSLDGGTNFKQASETISPITITGSLGNTIYRVVIKYRTNLTGDSGISNMVPAIRRSTNVPVNSGTSTPTPVINSITNNGTSFSVNYTQGQITGNPATIYYYSLDGGITFNQTSGTNPFTITSGIQKNMVYKVVMKHRIGTTENYSANSNMVPAIIPRYIPSNSNSITQYYNINNSNIMRYYPFDTDLLDYQSGVGVSNVTSIDASASISNTSTVLTSGSMHFKPGNTNGIQIPNISINSNGVTIAYWAKIINNRTAQRIFEFYSENLYSLFLCVDMNSSGTFSLNYTGLDGYSTNYTLNDNEWHHYCYTISSNRNIMFYVDGLNTLSSTATANYNPSSSFFYSAIGGSNYNTDAQNAYINQFVIFNRALDATEIGYLKTNPLDVRFTSNLTGLSSPPPVITSITNDGTSFNVNFTQDTTGSPDAYFYSLDGGITFAPNSQPNSPITITSGIRSKIVYKVVIKNISSTGESTLSNMMAAVLS